METLEQKPAAQVAIDELRDAAMTPEDQTYLDMEQAKLDQERLDAGLGKTAAEIGQTALPELVAGPGGVAVPKAEVEHVIESGQELFEDNNRRG